MNAPPRVSVLTAAYQVPHLLERAIDSLLAQSDPNWELVIAPDDGCDYSALARRDPRIRIAASDVVAGGPGPARNRALAAAGGTWVAVLDDDDILAPNFIGAVRSALVTRDMVLVPTSYRTSDGRPLRDIGAGFSRMTISDVSVQFGSLHVAGRRELVGQWPACFAEDVVHTCRAIDRCGGSIEVVQATRYCNIVREASICTSRPDIDAQYALLEQDRFDGMRPAAAAQTRALFRLRRRVNLAFEARAERAIGYHEFVLANRKIAGK